MKKCCVVLLLVAFLAMSVTPLFAADWGGTAHVTVVAIDYFPNAIFFGLDAGSAACPAGTSLYYPFTNVDQAKAVLAVLMAAKLSGTTVWVNMNNDCSVVGVASN